MSSLRLWVVVSAPYWRMRCLGVPGCSGRSRSERVDLLRQPGHYDRAVPLRYFRRHPAARCIAVHSRMPKEVRLQPQLERRVVVIRASSQLARWAASMALSSSGKPAKILAKPWQIS